MIFLVTLCALVFIAVSIFNHTQKTVLSPKNATFQQLQSNYLPVYYLAVFSDWLQGPYVYKLYSDYGYEEEDIAVLYITGFASSSLFGSIVGHLADRYGRKKLCVSFGFIYSVCCLTKISRGFYMLLLGRVLGGISTSILFSTFEAWYINEHVNHFSLPPEWLNITLSKAFFFNGFMAILAGILAQIFAETLSLGPASPFILAIPFLLASSYLVLKNWKEHSHPQTSSHQSFTAPLYHIFYKDPFLLILGLIQSLFEAVMYIFIFSWTPILSELNPPLGIVFASFMLAFMLGSKIYGMVLSDGIPPQLILVLTCGLSFLSLGTVSMVITYLLYSADDNTLTRLQLTQICFVSFVLYELSVGLYFPAIGYLKGRVLPEEHRASLANWFRLPMNIFTCISLMLNQVNKNNVRNVSPSMIVFDKFHMTYFLCSVFLLLTTSASYVFKQKYTRKYAKEESFNEPKDVKDSDTVKEKSKSNSS